MDRCTAEALAAINRDFYRRHAAAFSHTRSRRWAGWERLLELARRQWQKRPASACPRVLDLGCGNGRFLAFLECRQRSPFRYLGVDSSQPLVRLAQERHPAGRFHCLDALADGELERLEDQPHSLIALFGLLHHLPGFERRRRLLERLVRLLEPGGLLALSCWQFAADARLRRRIIPWEEHNREWPAAIDTAQLESGDYLLRWGEAAAVGSPRRYCHYTDPDEARRLTSGIGLRRLASFTDDGHERNRNLYLLLQRP